MSIDHYGDWHPDTDYAPGDLAWFGGRRYRAVIDSRGKCPGEPIYRGAWRRAPKPMKIGCGRGRGRRML